MKASDAHQDRVAHAALFNALWAFFVLIHIYKLTPWTSGVTPDLRIVNWLLISTSLFVIFRPEKVWLFLVLNGFHFVSVLIQLPGMANCWLFSGILSAGFIATYISLMRSHGWRDFSVADIYERFVPAVRFSLFALYGFAVLAKLNTAFLDPDTSCASCFCELMLSTYGVTSPPEWVLWSAIPGTIFAEMAIPLLLVFQRTRVFGVFLGLVFHTAIAHSYKILVFDFSALMLALYFSFTNPQLMTILRESKNALIFRWIAKHRQSIFALLTLLFLGLMLALHNKPSYALTVVYKFRGLIWTVLGCGLAIFTFFEFVTQRQKVFNVERPFRMNSAIPAVAVAFILINGLSPYLGLKTGVSYTMFSNLRTEHGFENHLFMPSSMKIFPYQNESVLPLGSSEPELQRLADAKERLLIHDLRSKISKFPSASLRYEIDGKVRFAESVAVDPLIGKPLSYLESKLLFFRTIPTYNHRHQW